MAKRTDHLSAVFKVRVSDDLLTAIRAEAVRLHLRPADIARMALAERVDPSRDAQQPAPVAAT